MPTRFIDVYNTKTKRKARIPEKALSTFPDWERTERQKAADAAEAETTTDAAAAETPAVPAVEGTPTPPTTTKATSRQAPATNKEA